MTLIKGHLNQLLTTYAVATAKSPGFIADRVAPPQRVQNYSDSYLVFGDEELRLDGSSYSEKSNIGRVSFSESDTTYLCKEYAQEAQISWLRMSNADAALALERRYTAGLVNKLRLRREQQVADLMANASTFTQTAALAGADRWDVDTSSPVSKVNDAKETVRAACGLVPNSIVMGGHVWSHLRIHPDITSRVAGLVAGTPATEAQAAAALGVDNIIVGNAIKVSSLEGATETRADVWGKIASVCFIDPNVGGDASGTLTPAQQFVCEAVASAFSTFTYEENQTRSHVIQVYDCVDVKAIAVASAYLYTTVVS